MVTISITKIAAELGVTKDYALRLVKRRATALGIRPERGRRNAVSLSREDADRKKGNGVKAIYFTYH
jgi:hypothetical protein